MNIQLTSRDDPRQAHIVNANILRELVRYGTHHYRTAAALELDLGNNPDAPLELSIAGDLLIEWLDKMAPASCYAEVHSAIETRQSAAEYATPQELIDAYLAEVRRTAGDAYATNTRLWYNPIDGWYHLHAPYKTGPNRYTPSGVGRSYRAPDIKRLVGRMRERRDFAPELDKPARSVIE